MAQRLAAAGGAQNSAQPARLAGRRRLRAACPAAARLMAPSLQAAEAAGSAERRSGHLGRQAVRRCRVRRAHPVRLVQRVGVGNCSDADRPVRCRAAGRQRPEEEAAAAVAAVTSAVAARLQPEEEAAATVAARRGAAVAASTVAQPEAAAVAASAVALLEEAAEVEVAMEAAPQGEAEVAMAAAPQGAAEAAGSAAQPVAAVVAAEAAPRVARREAAAVEAAWRREAALPSAAASRPSSLVRAGPGWAEPAQQRTYRRRLRPVRALWFVRATASS
jgi:hypothetical protein